MSGLFFNNGYRNQSSMAIPNVVGRPRLSPLVAEGLNVMPFDITANSVYYDLSINGATANVTNAATYSFSCAFYTVSADSLILVNSGSTSFAWAADANASLSVIGQRYVSFVSSQFSSLPVFSQGVEYYQAFNYSSAGASTLSVFNIMGFAGYTTNATQRSGSFGGSGNTAATTAGFIPFLGGYSTTTATPPGTIANSEVRKTSVVDFLMPHVIFNNNPSLSAF
jgi:hypothetical protein